VHFSPPIFLALLSSLDVAGDLPVKAHRRAEFIGAGRAHDQLQEIDPATGRRSDALTRPPSTLPRDRTAHQREHASPRRVAVVACRLMTRAELFDAVLALPEADRAALIATLIESLDGDVDPDAQSAWGAEIERRLALIDAGQGTRLAIDDAVARLHKAARGS
jgi:putative addiction module component (TIGR02574 family)